MTAKRVQYLSASSIRTFQQCRLKFHYNYHKRIGSPYSDNLVLGIAVHGALEKLYQIMEGVERSPNEAEQKILHDEAIRILAERGIESTKVIGDTLELLDIGINRFNPMEKVLALEKKFKFYTDEGVPIAGSIDKVVELQPDTLGIFDYKTSYVAMTQGEIDHDIQLSVYDLAASYLYPKYEKRVLVLDYIRHDQLASTRNEGDRKLFSEFLVEVNGQIKDLDEDNSFASLNKYCGWCGYKDICPKYSALPDLMVDGAKPLEEFTDTELIEEWDRVKLAKKLIESRIDDLKMKIVGDLRESGKRNISNKNGSLYVTQSARKNYDARDLAEVVPIEDLLGLVSVNSRRLSNYIKSNSEHKERIEKASTKSFTSPILRKGK